MQLLKNKYSIAIIFATLVISCNKGITERTIPDFEPTTTDALGGSWKTIVLANGSEPLIAAPDAVTSAAYQAELTNITQLQNNLSTADKQLIDDWKSSGIIKWNTLARELVAKYNLPPEANADGTYPVPSAANPAGYPKFPFANPPYASRAYAYLHVAIYDALVSCWKYKYQYNRKAPSTNDTKIKALETIQSDLPSYPSDDAVVAQVSFRLLKTFFPLDSALQLQMANNQKKAKLLSGAASATDIAAGEAIANFVADKVLARSKTDGMGGSVGNPTLWAQLESGAAINGTSLPWKSLEIPARPPMLPYFGNVKLWNMNAFQRDSARPAAPPAIGSIAFTKALDEVRSYDRTGNSTTWKIALFWGDGVGSYTPPGHWNEIACNIIAANELNELRTARTLSLLNMAINDAGVCCWDTKTYYYYPRPSQIDGSIKTIGTPNFPSYTSGHSTFSGAAATVLSYIFPQEKTTLEAMAMQASESRIYGGIHYRFDCEVGLVCGNGIGSFSVKRGKADGSN
ncbi:MAG: phosphatase PAP2 family protein [Deinococcales bacterium]|nr:phosphatase PAP2 family protein [Chitinophagaceae bacterium]